MKNVEMKVDKKAKTLTIIVDLSEDHGPSSSGKTTIIASSEGNQKIPGFEAENMMIGLNVYKKRGA